MTATNRIPGRPEWASGPLYNLMTDIFPEYRTTLGVLDVQMLKLALNKSHEAIYKWFRHGKIKPDNARAIVAAASTPENIQALAKTGREPPVFEDFLPFF